jgi:hypothetical protein
MSTSMVVPVRWPAPDAIGAFSSTRRGGVSSGSFASLNLSACAGDAAANVAENVARLTAACALPHAPQWPRQVHGSAVVEAGRLHRAAVQADAVFTSRPGVICSVRTADCLPVLLCARDASAVAAAHAGWRGLAAGVLEAAVSALQVPPAAILAWLGPAIGPAVYEVGDEVRSAFLAVDRAAGTAFARSARGRWLADLYTLARQRLRGAGVQEIHGGGYCTYTDRLRFYSYRRDGASGRMASGIWIKPRA